MRSAMRVPPSRWYTDIRSRVATVKATVARPRPADSRSSIRSASAPGTWMRSRIYCTPCGALQVMTRRSPYRRIEMRGCPRSRRERSPPGSRVWRTAARRTSVGVKAIVAQQPGDRGAVAKRDRAAQVRVRERVDLERHDPAPAIARSTLLAKARYFSVVVPPEQRPHAAAFRRSSRGGSVESPARSGLLVAFSARIAQLPLSVRATAHPELRHVHHRNEPRRSRSGRAAPRSSTRSSSCSASRSSSSRSARARAYSVACCSLHRVWIAPSRRRAHHRRSGSTCSASSTSGALVAGAARPSRRQAARLPRHRARRHRLRRRMDAVHRPDPRLHPRSTPRAPPICIAACCCSSRTRPGSRSRSSSPRSPSIAFSPCSPASAAR